MSLNSWFSKFSSFHITSLLLPKNWIHVSPFIDFSSSFKFCVTFGFITNNFIVIWSHCARLSFVSPFQIVDRDVGEVQSHCAAGQVNPARKKPATVLVQFLASQQCCFHCWTCKKSTCIAIRHVFASKSPQVSCRNTPFMSVIFVTVDLQRPRTWAWGPTRQARAQTEGSDDKNRWVSFSGVILSGWLFLSLQVRNNRV